MKILHLLSQIQVTGAETYAASLIEWQQEQGHEVWILSDTFATETTAHYQSLPVDNRSFLQRIKNIFAVRRFIRLHQIDVVHAHSRASSWVGYFATRWTRLPLISTVHGKQKTSLSKKLWNMYGEQIIAVSPNVARQITTQLNLGRVINYRRTDDRPQRSRDR
jgi:hypothetical protein